MLVFDGLRLAACLLACCLELLNGFGCLWFWVVWFSCGWCLLWDMLLICFVLIYLGGCCRFWFDNGCSVVKVFLLLIMLCDVGRVVWYWLVHWFAGFALIIGIVGKLLFGCLCGICGGCWFVFVRWLTDRCFMLMVGLFCWHVGFYYFTVV